MVAKWNEAKIRKLLNENPLAVERAILAIYDRQTADEKATSDTRHHNARGFSAAHAKRGSYYGRWIRSGRHLSGHHVQKAREIALHYVSQLLLVAQEKAKSEQPARQRYMGGDKPMSDFEARVRDYMRQTGQPRDAAEHVVRNVLAGKCPDGCCGGEVEERARRIEDEEDGREQYKNALFEHNAEREMQRMEAEGDREQTRREELAKAQAKATMESSKCLRRVNKNLSCFCASCAPDAPPPYGET